MAKKGPMTYEELATSLGSKAKSPHSGDKAQPKAASSSAVRSYDFSKPGPAAEPSASPSKPRVAGTPPKQAGPSPGVAKQLAQLASDVSTNTTGLKRLEGALDSSVVDIATVNSNVDVVLNRLIELEQLVHEYLAVKDEDPNDSEPPASPGPGEDPVDPAH